MKHARLVCMGLFGLLLCIGCDASKIVKSGTIMPYSFTTRLTSNAELLRQGDIDAVKHLSRPDGVEIDAWALRHTTQEPARGTVVLLHGDGEWKYYYLGIAKALARKGYDSILVDLRCHGWSTGEYITGGAKEKYDVKAVVDAFIEGGTIPDGPITVFGVTYGGATAIQYAAIDPRVRGVVVMAPWASMADKARRDLGALASQDKVDTELAKAGELADFDPAEASAVAAAGKLTCPVYIIHGAFDMTVPVAESEKIYQAIPHENKRLQILVPGTPETLELVDFDGWRAARIADLAERRFIPGRTSGGIQQDPGSPATQPDAP